MQGALRSIRRFFAVSDASGNQETRPRTREFALTEDAVAFERHTRLHLAFLGRISAAICIVGALLWWPADWVIYAGSLQRHGPPQQFRLTLCALCALYLLLSRTDFLLRHALWSIAAMMTAVMATLGATGGAQGGLDQPWYHLAYPLLCVSLLYPAPLRQRMVVVTMQALGSLGGLLLPHPEYCASPYLPLTLSMIFLTTVASTALGHYNFLLFRDNFRQAQELARNAAELEARVAEKTRDVRDLLAHSEALLDKERARISRDLHDELGQELTAVRYAVSLTHARFLKAPHTIETNLIEIDHILQRTLKTMRGMVSELRPPLLDDLGLHAAADWLTKRVGERSGLKCELRLDGDDQDLPADVVTTAYRLLQEALTNAARHAQATEVKVSLSIATSCIQLSVRDNGCGFDTSQRSPGMGLLGMRERALAAGAKLVVMSRPGAGTEIECSLPLSPGAALSPASKHARAQMPAAT